MGFAPTCFVCRGRFHRMMIKDPNSAAHSLHSYYTVSLEEELADLSRPPDIFLCGICLFLIEHPAEARKFLLHKALPDRRQRVAVEEREP